jgi:hypothetical protein
MSWKSTALATAVSAVAVTPAAFAADNPLTADIAGHPTVRHHMRAAQRAELRADLSDRARELGASRREVRGRRIAGLRDLVAELRADRRERREARAQERKFASTGVSPALAAIAACESGGNPRAIGGGGAYRGKYQFSFATWAAVGGSGDPAAASVAEQDHRAALLYAQAGPGQWPVCGR